MPVGVFIRTKEHGQNISKALMGKKRSKEARQAISKGRMGIKFSEEHRQNLSKSHVGIRLSEEARRNYSKEQEKRWAKRTKEERTRYNMVFQKAGTKATIEKFAKMTKKQRRNHPWVKAGIIASQKANPSSIEKAIWKILDEFGISYETHISFNNGKFIVDIYIPTQRLIIECNGDYWHNLPTRKRRDKKLRKYAMNNSYKLVELWESEIRKNPKQALEEGFTKINQ